jgi:hypothetical protein
VKDYEEGVNNYVDKMELKKYQKLLGEQNEMAEKPYHRCEMEERERRESQRDILRDTDEEYEWRD